MAIVAASDYDYEEDILADDTWSTNSVARSAGRGLDEDRRYVDLHDIAKKIWNENTGHTVATASCSETDQCPKWEKELQSMLLTSDAKPTRTARNVSENNMVNSALENS